MEVRSFNTVLFEVVRQKELAIFVGAGVSMCPPSNLPSWNLLKDNILDALIKAINDVDLPKEQITKIYEHLSNSKLSPELVFEAIDSVDPLSAKRALALSLPQRSPNPVHRVIAYLAKHGFVRVIVTTNFDNLLEIALNEENVSFVTLIKTPDFSNFYLYGIKFFLNPNYKSPVPDWFEKVCPSGKFPSLAIAKKKDPFRKRISKELETRYNVQTVIMKLHGSLKHPNSLLFTTNDTFGEISDAKQKLIRFTLSQYHTLYLGYSGRDIDIAPVISNLRMTYDSKTSVPHITVPFDQYDAEELPQEIFHLNYVPSRKALWIVRPHQKDKNKWISRILSTYGNDGIEVEYDLLDFSYAIASFLSKLGFECILPNVQRDDTNSTLQFDSLKEWANNISPSMKLSAISILLNHIGKNKLSETLYVQAEYKALDERERYRIGLQRLSLHFDSFGNVKTIEQLRKLKRLAYSIDAETAISYRIFEGQILLKLGILDEAEKAFVEVLANTYALAKVDAGRLSNLSPVYGAKALNGMAAIHLINKDANGAQTALKAARDIVNSNITILNEMLGERAVSLIMAQTLANLAYCYYKSGDEDNTKRTLLDALQASARAQEPGPQILILQRLVNELKKKGLMNDAAFYLEKARNLIERGYGISELPEVFNE